MSEQNEQIEEHIDGIDQVHFSGDLKKIEIKKTRNGKKYVCGTCLEEFSTPQAKSRCKRKHKVENGEIEPHKCQKCNAEYSRKDKLTNHLLTCGKKKMRRAKKSHGVLTVKGPKLVSRDEFNHEFQLLRDQLATAAAQKAAKNSLPSLKIIHFCHRCKRVFDSPKSIEKHDEKCIRNSAFITENPKVRASAINQLVGDYKHELMIALLESSLNANPSFKTDEAIVDEIERSSESESSKLNASRDYDIDDVNERSNSSSGSDSFSEKMNKLKRGKDSSEHPQNYDVYSSSDSDSSVDSDGRDSSERKSLRAHSTGADDHSNSDTGCNQSDSDCSDKTNVRDLEKGNGSLSECSVAMDHTSSDNEENRNANEAMEEGKGSHSHSPTGGDDQNDTGVDNLCDNKIIVTGEKNIIGSENAAEAECASAMLIRQLTESPTSLSVDQPHVNVSPLHTPSDLFTVQGYQYLTGVFSQQF